MIKEQISNSVQSRAATEGRVRGVRSLRKWLAILLDCRSYRRRGTASAVPMKCNLMRAALAAEGISLKPARQIRSEPGSTYFVSSQTYERRPFFRHERWALTFIDTLCHYRGKSYLLHEYVVMPDHFHCLLTPVVPLERAVQLIKGGFSRRASVELESRFEVWQRGFTDHRIRDAEDYRRHHLYLVENPVRAGLCESPESYAYSSFGKQLDMIPPRLKPLSWRGL